MFFPLYLFQFQVCDLQGMFILFKGCKKTDFVSLMLYKVRIPTVLAPNSKQNDQTQKQKSQHFSTIFTEAKQPRHLCNFSIVFFKKFEFRIYML